MFPFLEAFTDMRTGIALGQGGASELIDALVALGRESGLELRCGADVELVRVAGGVATGVQLTTGEFIEARRAVIAGVTPPVLYGRLLAGVDLPASLRRAARRYQHGPGTLMVHLALSAPPAWAGGEDLSRFAYVHIAPYVDDLASTYPQACGGLLPSEPMLVVGQTSAVDPTRCSDGALLWIQVRALPGTIRGDAAGVIDARDWSAAAEPYADRVLAKLERYAPGITDLVLDRAVLTPADLERHDPEPGGRRLDRRQHAPAPELPLPPVPGGARLRDGGRPAADGRGRHLAGGRGQRDLRLQRGAEAAGAAAAPGRRRQAGGQRRPRSSRVALAIRPSPPMIRSATIRPEAAFRPGPGRSRRRTDTGSAPVWRARRRRAAAATGKTGRARSRPSRCRLGPGWGYAARARPATASHAAPGRRASSQRAVKR